MVIPKRFHLIPDNPPNEEIMFINHEPNGRSGHLGHAMVEYGPGKILVFYLYCFAEDTRWKGHSSYGWMEYKRSVDAGETWSKPMFEPNSKTLFSRYEGRTEMCEKAICTDSGRILLFYLTCDMITNTHLWEPYFEPRVAYNDDEGETWSEDKHLIDETGRVFDVLYRNGIIYVLFFSNASGIDHSLEHDYILLVSEDNGETFHVRSKLSFQSTMNCFYGTMTFRDDGSLTAYIYNERDEYNLKYVAGHDNGYHWSINRRSFFEQKIRNPQIVQFDGTWFYHGRSGFIGDNSHHFIFIYI